MNKYTLPEDPFSKPHPDVEYAFNSLTSTIYTSDFNQGKYINTYFDEEAENFIQISKKIRLRITCIKNQIKGIKLTTFNESNQVGEIILSSFSINQICEFLELIKGLDIAELSNRKISLTRQANDDAKKTISSLITKTLEANTQAELIYDLLNNGLVTNEDIVNTGYRKLSLQKFKKLLNDDSYIDTYKNENSIQNSSPEKVWQHFFKNNPWIFGYGLDYRFQSILQDEANLNSANLGGKNAVNADFLLGDNKFTTFVEIKRPDTKLFGEKKNRSNSWKLSTDLYEAHSQILEHKASGQIKLSESSREYDENGNEIKQKAYDSKTILIIGTWKEINLGNAQEIKIKEKTFELFRQNSKNVEIMTFDELYERAKFIVGH